MKNFGLLPVTAVILTSLLAISLAPRTADACGAPPPSSSMKVLPLAGSIAPRNTKLWLKREFATDGTALPVQLYKVNGKQVPLTETVLKNGISQEAALSVFTPDGALAPNSEYEIRVDGTTRQTFSTSEEIDNTPPATPELGWSATSSHAQFNVRGSSDLAFLVEPSDMVAAMPSKVRDVTNTEVLGPVDPTVTLSGTPEFGMLAVDLAGNVSASNVVTVQLDPTAAAGCSATSSAPALLGLMLLVGALRRRAQKS